MEAGVDEAGKGPVLGSMFVGAVAVPDRTVLPTAVADSKTISAETRTDLVSELHAAPTVQTTTVEVPVDRIDDPQTDMRTLTVKAHAAAIDRLDGDITAVTVDAADTDADRFARRVDAATSHSPAITARHGADAADPLVGAASIIAKAARERHVDALADTYGQIGSGYPNDPQTRSFLQTYIETHGEAPPCARRSWETTQTLYAAATQSSLEEF